MKHNLFVILALLVCWTSDSLVSAQETIDEKRKRADELFEEQKWVDAQALYNSIITSAPRDHDLNFRYGTSILNGSKDQEEAIRFLKYSITGAAIDKRAYYYLGKAYHLNYQFNDAIKYYSKFQELASPNDLKAINVSSDLKACAFGKKLLSNITDMIVIKKDELPAEDFYDIYDLSDIGGQLIVTDLFQSKIDKKKNHRPIIHFPVNSPYIYYSSYGDNEDSGLDIYVKKKLPDGEWSLAQKVVGGVNTELDEDFAYMHPNGEYLYFSSKGHNSMGGYDVFRCRYNVNSQSFGPPENMDFAISSPDDDIFFVVDSLDQNAYFASARESAQGKMSVYKVRVDRIPMQMAVIKGNFLNTINEGAKEVEVVVTDFSTGELIGKFNSKKTNGDYLLTFPKSGKYDFAITVKGSMDTYGYRVNIPYSKDFKPLGQQITLIENNGEEQITVKDLFDKEFDDPAGILAEVYREMSKLPPNADDFNLDSLDALKQTDKILVDAGLDPYLTKNGLKAILKDNIEDLTIAKDQEQKQANIAYNVGLKKSIEANERMVALNEQIKLAEATDDPIEKNRILSDVKKEKAEVQSLNNEAQVLIDLASSIERSVKEKQVRIDEGNRVYEQAIGMEDENREALLDLVKSNQVYFETNIKGNPPIENAANNALSKGADEQKRIQALSEEISQINTEKIELVAQNKRLTDQLEGAKKKDKELLQQRINSNNSDIALLESTLEEKNKAFNQAIEENNVVREGLAASIVLKENYKGTKYENALSNEDKETIISQIKSNDLEESLVMIDQVLEENDVSAFNIDLYANDDTRANYSIEDWEDEINKEQERLRQEKLTASAERQAQIQAEIDKLEKLRQEKLDQYEIIEEDPESIEADVRQEEILPSYEQRKTSIGTIVTEVDRRNANRELNYELVEEIQREREKLEVLLAKNPKAKNIKERLENLDELERVIQEEIKADEEWIVANELADPLNKEEVLYTIAPDYKEKSKKAYEIVEDEPRKKAIYELNQSVISKANERLQEVDAILVEKPNDQKLKQEKVGLEELIVLLNEDLNKPLYEVIEDTSAESSETVTIVDLVPDFDDREEVILNMENSSKSRLAENDLYKEIIVAAEEEENKINNLLADDPENSALKVRKSAVVEIKNEYTSKLAENEEWLANNPTEVPDEIQRLNLNPQPNTLMKDYDDRMVKIESSNQSEIEKESNKKSVNQDLIALIDKETDEANNLLNKYPEQAERINQRKVNLDALKTEVNNKIDANDAKIASLSNENNTEQLTNNENQNGDDDTNNGDNQTANNNQNNDSNPANSDEDNQNEGAAQQNDPDGNSNDVDGNTKSREPITVMSLMPNFVAEITDINNSNAPELEKLDQSIALHKVLIDKSNEKIGDLEVEKEQNPEAASAIDKDIAEVKNIQRDAQNAININLENISKLKSDNLNRPDITVEEILPGFESEMASIINGDGEEVDKLKAKNELNNRLLKAIEIKSESIQSEKENDPDHAEIYEEELDKLSELKEAKRSEVAQNNEEISALEAEDLNLADLSPQDFSSEQGTEIVAEFDKEIDELNEINLAIEGLNNELNSSTNEKEQAKIQKKIEKETTKKATIENELIEALETVNDQEVNDLKEELDLDQKIAEKSSAIVENGMGDVVAEASNDLILANGKMAEAQRLRDEAQEIKDPIATNEKLKEAYQLESQAKEMIKGANRRFKMAISLNDEADEENVITAVDENEENRNSTLKEQEAADLRALANNYYLRSTELADQSENAKKKDRPALIAESEKIANEASRLERQADLLEEEAEVLKVQEEELLERTLKPVDITVDDETSEEIATSEGYENFYTKKQEGDAKMSKIADLSAEIDSLKSKRARRFKMAISLNDDQDEVSPDVKNEIEDIQVQINQLTALKKQLKEEALTAFDEANDILNTQVNESHHDAALAMAEQNFQPREKLIPEVADFEVPDEITEDIFRKTAGAVYSEDTPIPMNTKITGGLVYKVQVGAFRNPLPQDHFKEFAPISGEKLNNGITRYMVGYFKKFVPANEAKTEVNGIGYSDAFVVAYCNGVRITIEQALQIEEGVVDCEPQENYVDNTILDQSFNQAADDQIENNNSNVEIAETNEPPQNVDFSNDNKDRSDLVDNKPKNEQERTATSYYRNATNPAKAKQIELIDGLFYTVQIGVFSQPVEKDGLYGIQPLNTQRTANGFIRYSTGIFTSVEDAVKRKNEVVQIGVPDAFVTAYFDGERITIDEALAVLQREGAEALVGHASRLNNQNNDIPEEVVYYKEGLFYKILIGKYKDAIPGEYATLLLRGDDIFETEVDLEGRTVLMSTKIESYEELMSRLKEFSDLGIEKMNIVTYYKYDVIPFEQGQKIRNDEKFDELTPYDDIEGIDASPYIYDKEAVYFKVKLGEFEDKVSPEFTNLLLLHEAEEGILREEKLDGITEFYTESISTYDNAITKKNVLVEKGFSQAKLVAYHKYDEISVETAKDILQE